MYFSDNEYYSLVESIKDLHNFTVLQQQSLTDNTKVLLSLNNSYQNNAQAILKLLLQGIGQKSQERSEQILEIDLRDCPEILETHFQNSLNQIQNKNKEIIDKLLICQQKIEFRAKRQKCLQKNASWELALKEEVEIMRKKTLQLNEALQQVEIWYIKLWNSIPSKFNMRKG
ncbi:unnamed protein product [Paramecium octaurelia]|uniref:Uncharacterized protein n=1 Tax=Paramecium octaurelia TaxID=43137 RepID=A0A8S1U5S1_PAROT|nr:unnamed protein product [Paramecium octaurelia]